MKSRFLFVVSAGVASAIAVAAPVPVGPAAKSFRLGAFRVTALRDMVNAVPNDGSVFGKDVGPAAVKTLLDADHLDDTTLQLGVDALLVQEPGRTILIDTGLGPKVGGALPRSLALAGIDPAAVTDVLITHSHGDHVGGLVTATGALAFPNATIRLSATEWAWMQGKPSNAELAAAIAFKVRTFSPGGVVAPGIRSVPLAGHTPGHVGYQIKSEGQRLIDIGDVAHSAVVSLEKPAWINGYDTDATGGRVRRETTLAMLAAHGDHVFAPHFPFPGTGKIVKTASGYAWQPDR
ncbi:MBL fold metallo-hydrolase [uncultured Sphingomonas sp.]|uniref:MBL fold metallo-hydrolase n=1 Tax=uncultured Sphingomonas sp. TaxID=158754 RepID=UPI0035CBF23C